MKTIQQYLSRYNACKKANSIVSLHDAVNMLFTPQGREFCKKSHFPSIEFLRENIDEINSFKTCFVDAGVVSTADHRIFVAGDTFAEIFASRPDEIYYVVAMHGAEVRIIADEYSVVTVLVVDAECEVENDGTAKISFE